MEPSPPHGVDPVPANKARTAAATAARVRKAMEKMAARLRANGWLTIPPEVLPTPSRVAETSHETRLMMKAAQQVINLDLTSGAHILISTGSGDVVWIVRGDPDAALTWASTRQPTGPDRKEKP